MKIHPLIRLIARVALLITDPWLRFRLREVSAFEQEYKAASPLVRAAVQPHVAVIQEQLRNLEAHRNQLRQMAGLPIVEHTE